MKDQIETVKDILGEKEYRLTPQREAVLKILIQGKEAHLSADEIYFATKERFPEIGLATVYRTLELFEELGVIHRLEFGDGGNRYEFNPSGSKKHYHHHLICQKCGGITEVEDDLLDDLEEVIVKKSGFKITDHCLRVYGYCSKCQ